jgi:hypothetical protein
VERLLHETLASIGRNILRSIRVSLKKERNLPVCLWLPPFSLISSCVVFLQLLSQGSTDVPALLVKVARAWEVAASVEANHIATVLAA